MDNECQKCGGELKKGIYLANTLSYASQAKMRRLIASGYSGVTTVWNGGPGKIKPCIKCTRCGWSFE